MWLIWGRPMLMSVYLLVPRAAESRTILISTKRFIFLPRMNSYFLAAVSSMKWILDPVDHDPNSLCNF